MKRAKSAESEGIIMNKQPKYKIDNAKLTRLVTKAQNGSQKALEEVINMVSGYLYYYSLTLLGDEEQAKDAVQDILLTVLKKLNTLADPKAFLGWLKTITSNYCKTKLSRAKDHVSLDEGTWEFSDESDQICPEKSAEADEVCAYVREAVRSLPQVLRESVMMFYFHQMSIRQIADVLEVNENTVKSRLYSARQSMKKYLEQYGGAALASCAVPPLSMLSFSLIQAAERQKGILIPYATPAGEVKVAFINSAASGAIPVKIAAIGAACIVTIGGVSTVAMQGMPVEKKTSVPAITATSAHRLTEQMTTDANEEKEYTTAPFSTVAPTTRPAAVSGEAAEIVPTQAQQNTVQTAPVQTPAPATTAAAVTVTPVTTAPVTVPADQRKIYIDTSGLKNDTTQPFCHIYGDESEFYSWGSKKEYCTLVSGSIYSYDLNPLALKDDAVYHVAFGTVGGSITEDLEFTTANYGATMLVEVNPIYADHDPYKNKYLAKWK